MYSSDNMIQNIDIINDTFDIVEQDNNPDTIIEINNGEIRYISINSTKTQINIHFIDEDISDVILENFGDVENAVACFVLLKKTNSSLNNKHDVDVLNYKETLVNRYDYYHLYDPETLIHSININKKEVICVDILDTISIVLHPHITSMVRRKDNIVYIISGVDNEKTFLRFESIENAVIAVEKLHEVFDLFSPTNMIIYNN